jgi:hypothetical protein
LIPQSAIVCVPGDLLDGREVEEVLPEVFFRERVRRGMIELGELRDRARVGLDGAISIAAELQVLDHAVAEWSHGILSERGESHHSTSLRHRHQSHRSQTSR